MSGFVCDLVELSAKWLFKITKKLILMTQVNLFFFTESMGEREENKGKGEGMGEGEGEGMGEGEGEGEETSGESEPTVEPAAKRRVHKRKFHKSVA